MINDLPDPNNVPDDQLLRDIDWLYPHAVRKSELCREAQQLFRYLRVYLNRNLNATSLRSSQLPPMGECGNVPDVAKVLPQEQHECIHIFLLKGRNLGDGQGKAVNTEFCPKCGETKETEI